MYSKRLPSVAIRRALRGQPLPGRTIKLHTCGRCKGRYPSEAMDYGGIICKRCRAQAEAASVAVMEEDEHEWCERRAAIEAWLDARGL